LLSSFDENHSRTSDFEDEDKARDALYTLDTESVLSDLVAVENYSKTLTASNGKIASA
jgi:carboxymethylenebutenolidase